MSRIADKLKTLGAKLAPPAPLTEIHDLESRLGLTLPTDLREFLLEHNGTIGETDEGMWRFWPCSEIQSRTDYRGETVFPVQDGFLEGKKLILFADAFFELPTYGFYVDPNHPFDGFVFDEVVGCVSATSFTEWTAYFVERAESCVVTLNFEDT